MFVNCFLLGACFAVNACIFVIAYLNRSKNAPYREAFAWLGFVSALQCLCELLYFTVPEIQNNINKHTASCIDYFALPFVILEIECIIKQNLKELSWRARWTQLAISELPIVFIIISHFWIDWEHVRMTIYAWFIIYISAFTFWSIKNLIEYDNVLKYATDTKNRSIDWAVWIFLANIVLIVAYLLMAPSFDNTIIENMYLLLNITLMGVNAYFIWMQRPANIREMAKIRSILLDEEDIIKDKLEEMEEQIGILAEKKSMMDELSSEMSVNAEKLKRKATIKEYMDTMRLQYPHFVQNIKKIAEGRLTNHDILLCMLIFDGRKVSSIAKMTGVNVKSVEMARSRLRKKLKLTAQENLNDFIKEKGNENA